jgi:hypothetical protein
VWAGQDTTAYERNMTGELVIKICDAKNLLMYLYYQLIMHHMKLYVFQKKKKWAVRVNKNIEDNFQLLFLDRCITQTFCIFVFGFYCRLKGKLNALHITDLRGVSCKCICLHCVMIKDDI